MADYHWAVGVVMAAVASIISNLGLNLQKLCHVRMEGAAEEDKKQYYRSKLWIVGLCLIIVGSVADFAALAFGAQSIIAPLGSLTLVSNVFIAPCLLGETLTKRDVLATLTIIFGATIAVTFASHKDTIYGLRELFGFYEQPRFGLYAMSIVVTVGVLWSAIQYMEALRREDENSKKYLEVRSYHRFCYAALSGTIGAQSVLFAKCTAELVVNTLMGEGFLFSYYQTYMVMICCASTIFLQIKWLNQGLQRFDALYIVPVFQSFWILVSVLAGLIFFGEYREMNQMQSTMFPLGIFLTIAGVYFLSQRGVDEEFLHQHTDETRTPRDTTEDPEPVEGMKRERSASTDSASKQAYDPEMLPADITAHVVDDRAPLLTQPGQRTPPAGWPYFSSRHPHQRIDSRLGFMGPGAPAGFLPSRAMTLSSTMRSDATQPGEMDPVDEDDDGL